MTVLIGRFKPALYASVLFLAVAASMPMLAFSDGCPVDESTSGCLLELGKFPGETTLIPGLARGRIDAAPLEVAAGKGAKTRTWTAPDPREPGIMEDHIDIEGPLLHIHGIRERSYPYGVTKLTIRDPRIDLPCGLRIGQPIEKFIEILHPNLDQQLWKSRSKVRLDWDNYVLYDDICYASHALIFLQVSPTREVREISWGFFAD